MEKINILALFDDGTRSAYKALHGDKYNVFSVGVNKKHISDDNYYYIDITDIEAIEQLIKKTKPQLILASPPCNSWSIGGSGKVISGEQTGRTFSGIRYKDNLDVVKFDDFIQSNLLNLKRTKDAKKYYNKLTRNNIIGNCTQRATQELYNYSCKLKIPFLIENPRTSLIWRKFEDIKYYNYTEYNSYNSSYTRKPTTFAGNIELKLLKKGIIANRSVEDIQNKDKRSSIPKELYQDIAKQIFEKGE